MAKHPDEDPARDFGDYGNSYLIDQARRGVPGTVERVWREAQAGRLSDSDSKEWLDVVAEKVVHEILDCKLSGAERGAKAIHALGLRGRLDTLHEQRSDLNDWLAFDDLDDPGRKPTRREMLDYMRARGHFADLGEGDDENQMKRIDRLLSGEK